MVGSEENQVRTVADEIVHFLSTHSGPAGTGVTATGIAHGIQANFNTVRGRLSEMERAGEVVKNAAGFYSLPVVAMSVEDQSREDFINA
jgi:DNA-binding IclR family transcriptional regulator